MDGLFVGIDDSGGEEKKKTERTCIIQVAARRVSAPGGLEGYLHQSTLYHSYILVKEAGKPTTVFSAFPGKLIGQTDREDLLTATEDIYQKDNRDFDKSQSEGGTLYSDKIYDSCNDVFSSFQSLNKKVNDANIEYPGYISQALGLNQQNSNAYVFTLLSTRYGNKIARNTVGSLFPGNGAIKIPGIKTKLPIK